MRFGRQRRAGIDEPSVRAVFKTAVDDKIIARGLRRRRQRDVRRRDHRKREKRSNDTLHS